MRLIRLVGDPSLRDYPKILRKMIDLSMPEHLWIMFDRFEQKQRQVVQAGRSLWTLGPESGFGRTYTFGPYQFAVWMDDADAARLFANEWDRWQFVDITDEPWRTERRPLSDGEWAALLASFAKLSDQRRPLSENPRDYRQMFRRWQVAQPI